MLSTAQLESNQKRFLETNQKYNIFTKELLDFLGEAIYTSPASSSLNMIGCYPGGLLHHIIKGCRYAVKLNDILPDDLKQPTASIVKTAFLCQIGKTFMFKMNNNEYSLKGGKMYEFNDDIVRMKVGERSVFYALKYGVQFTEEEYQAILNIDKEDDDKMAKYFSAPLAQIIKNGFELATMEEKNEKKSNA